MICCTGLDLLQSSGEFPCAVCRTGVGSNSIFCNGCKHWVHKKCSGLKRLKKDPDYRCTRCRKTLSPPGPMMYLCSLALRIWTSFWRREDFDGMDMWNAPVVQSRQPLTYRLMESVGLGGPKWHGSSWQRGIAESGSSQLSALMIDVPGDLVWDLPCVQQASYLEGGPLMWMLPLYLHVNQKSNYDIWLYSILFWR